MTPTQQEIADAARLVPDVFAQDECAPPDDYWIVAGNRHYRYWQPWADTEAGRSDWAVLDTAVRVWEYNSLIEGNGVPHDLNMLLNEMHIAARRPWMLDRQRATFAAAAAIGKHLRESE